MMAVGSDGKDGGGENYLGRFAFDSKNPKPAKAIPHINNNIPHTTAK